MELIKWILQLLRVDTVDFMATLGLAIVLHFGGLIWAPLKAHQPDLSSGLYICAVLLLLMRPSSRQRSSEGQSVSFWHVIWPNSLKMTVTLMLLQHVALLRVWDNVVWLFDCTLYRWSNNARLLLAVILLSYAAFRWLYQLRDDAECAAAADAAAAIGTAVADDSTVSDLPLSDASQRCPYCSSILSSGTLIAKDLKEEPSTLKDELRKLVTFVQQGHGYLDEPLTDLQS